MASNMLTVSEDLNSAEAGTTSPTATSPVRPDIRRSLSPILDFGSRRNFCNISECSYCRPLAENHRPSPLRSPVAPPTASTKLISLHFSSCDAFVIFVCCRLVSSGCHSVCHCLRWQRSIAAPDTTMASIANHRSNVCCTATGCTRKKKGEQADKLIISKSGENRNAIGKWRPGHVDPGIPAGPPPVETSGDLKEPTRESGISIQRSVMRTRYLSRIRNDSLRFSEASS